MMLNSLNIQEQDSSPEPSNLKFEQLDSKVPFFTWIWLVSFQTFHIHEPFKHCKCTYLYHLRWLIPYTHHASVKNILGFRLNLSLLTYSLLYNHGPLKTHQWVPLLWSSRYPANFLPFIHLTISILKSLLIFSRDIWCLYMWLSPQLVNTPTSIVGAFCCSLLSRKYLLSWLHSFMLLCQKAVGLSLAPEIWTHHQPGAPSAEDTCTVRGAGNHDS